MFRTEQPKLLNIIFSSFFFQNMRESFCIIYCENMITFANHGIPLNALTLTLVHTQPLVICQWQYRCSLITNGFNGILTSGAPIQVSCDFPSAFPSLQFGSRRVVCSMTLFFKQI
jgi:hypothetical protein